MNIMTKKWSSVIIKLVFIIAFNIVFFELKGFDNTPAVWVAYAFVHISYLALLLTPFCVPKGKDADTVTYPLYFVSWFYFILTLIACGVFMYFDETPTNYSVITNVLLTALFLILFLSQVILGQRTQNGEGERAKKVAFIDNCCRSLELLKNDLDPSDDLYLKVADAYDLVHSSPIRSNDSVVDLENEAASILRNMRSLDLPQAKDRLSTLLDKLIKVFKERNTLLK